MSVSTIDQISYDRLRKLGDGSAGTVVYRGYLRAPSHVIAVKRIVKDKLKIATRELDILKIESHENVLSLICWEETQDFVFIGLDLCDCNLHDYIEGKFNPTSSSLTSREILQQMSLGIKHLHSLSPKIVHRDIKPRNILMKEINGTICIKISDFGLSKILTLDHSTYTKSEEIVGTLGYMAPEVIEDRRQNTSVDIFALGCVFYFVLTLGKNPFGDSVDCQTNIKSGRYSLDDLPENEPHFTKLLLSRMICHGSSSRPRIEDVLSHPYFLHTGAQELTKVINNFKDCGLQDSKTIQEYLMEQMKANPSLPDIGYYWITEICKDLCQEQQPSVLAANSVPVGIVSIPDHQENVAVGGLGQGVITHSNMMSLPNNQRPVVVNNIFVEKLEMRKVGHFAMGNTEIHNHGQTIEEESDSDDSETTPKEIHQNQSGPKQNNLTETTPDDIDLLDTIPKEIDSTETVLKEIEIKEVSPCQVDIENYTDYRQPDIIPRSPDGWDARDPKESNPLSCKAKYVIISHSVSGQSLDKKSGIALMKYFQNYHMDHLGWSDIGYSFVIGGDGTVYEGRGWNREGAHTKYYNLIGLGICLIGNFNNEKMTTAQINATKGLIGRGLAEGHIDEDFGLFGHRDCTPTDSPGDQAYNEIITWPHWNALSKIVKN